MDPPRAGEDAFLDTQAEDRNGEGPPPKKSKKSKKSTEEISECEINLTKTKTHPRLQRELGPVFREAKQRYKNKKVYHLPEDITSDKLTSQDLLDAWGHLKHEEWIWLHRDMSKRGHTLQKLANMVEHELDIEKSMKESRCTGCWEQCDNVKLIVCQCQGLREDEMPNCAVLCNECMEYCKTYVTTSDRCKYCFRLKTRRMRRLGDWAAV